MSDWADKRARPMCLRLTRAGVRDNAADHAELAALLRAIRREALEQAAALCVRRSAAEPHELEAEILALIDRPAPSAEPGEEE